MARGLYGVVFMTKKPSTKSQLTSFFNTLKAYKPFLIILSLFIIAYLIRMFTIPFPPDTMSDEKFYVTAAKSIIPTGHDTNPEHPPLGKYLIGLGILIFGDNSFGWRFIGALLGSIIPPLIYLIGMRVYNEKVGLLSGVFLLLDPLTYAMSCIAMLDIYLAFFVTCAFLAFVYQRYYMSAVLFGLACSVKFSAVFSICGVMMYLIYLRKWELVPWFFIIPFLTFLIISLPIMFIEGIWTWFGSTLYYLSWHWNLPTCEHTEIIASRPEGWLFNIKPFVFRKHLYKRIANANPVLYPLALPSSVYIAYLISKDRIEHITLLPVLWFATQYGLFFFLPRTRQFIFYLLPAVPAILLLAAWGILTLLEIVSNWFTKFRQCDAR
jgi:predicted membrane-bound dolichyl-phosphate-mannose-protein mannosyltransferase